MIEHIVGHLTIAKRVIPANELVFRHAVTMVLKNFVRGVGEENDGNTEQ